MQTQHMNMFFLLITYPPTFPVPPINFDYSSWRSLKLCIYYHSSVSPCSLFYTALINVFVFCVVGNVLFVVTTNIHSQMHDSLVHIIHLVPPCVFQSCIPSFVIDDQSKHLSKYRLFDSKAKIHIEDIAMHFANR